MKNWTVTKQTIAPNVDKYVCSKGKLWVQVDASTEQVESAERHYRSGGEKVVLNGEGLAGVKAAIEAFKADPTSHLNWHYWPIAFVRSEKESS